MREMDKLEQYLKEQGTPYKRLKRFSAKTDIELMDGDGGEQIVAYDGEGRRVWDVVCGYGTYGWKQGLLEAMGKAITRGEKDSDVLGYLTAGDVIDRLEAANEERQ